MILDMLTKDFASSLRRKPCPSCGEKCEHTPVAAIEYEVNEWTRDGFDIVQVPMRGHWRCSLCGNEHKAGACASMSQELIDLLEQETAK